MNSANSVISEGLAKIELEEGVFYNPRMRFCRDLDVLVFRQMPWKYLDALSASGIRGIRAKLEAGKEVVLNDFSRKAVEVIKRNLKLNGIEAEVRNEDARVLVSSELFPHVDVDPFGSPAPFIDPACFSAKRAISVTATDTAALCGSAVNSCMRKYSCFVEKTDFYPELGLRVLIAKVVCEATKYDKAAHPVVSWAKEHYYRAHFLVRRSPRLAAKVYEDVGYIAYCRKCLRRAGVRFGDTPPEFCSCGEKFRLYGPVWLGRIKDGNFLEKVVEVGKEELERYGDYRRKMEKALEFLRNLREEADSPFYYDLHAVCRAMSISPPPIARVLERLRELGYEASRTVLCGTGLRTDAGIDELREVLAGFS